MKIKIIDNMKEHATKKDIYFLFFAIAVLAISVIVAAVIPHQAPAIPQSVIQPMCRMP